MVGYERILIFKRPQCSIAKFDSRYESARGGDLPLFLFLSYSSSRWCSFIHSPDRSSESSLLMLLEEQFITSIAGNILTSCTSFLIQEARKRGSSFKQEGKIIAGFQIISTRKKICHLLDTSNYLLFKLYNFHILFSDSNRGWPNFQESRNAISSRRKILKRNTDVFCIFFFSFLLLLSFSFSFYRSFLSFSLRDTLTRKRRSLLFLFGARRTGPPVHEAINIITERERVGIIIAEDGEKEEQKMESGVNEKKEEAMVALMHAPTYPALPLLYVLLARRLLDYAGIRNFRDSSDSIGNRSRNWCCSTMRSYLDFGGNALRVRVVRFLSPPW